MRLLGVARTRPVPVRRRRNRVRTEPVGQERPDLGHRFRCEVHRVGAHVGDEPFATDPLVELLCDTHGAAHGETETVRRLLLQGGGGERGGRSPPALLRGDGQHLEAPRRMQLERRLSGERRPLVGERELFHLLTPVLREPGGEGRGAGRIRKHRPVLARLERIDLRLPVGDEAQGRALHATGGEVGTDLRPEHRRQVEPDEIVERAAGKLGVHQVGLELPGMLERLADRAARDLVELHPIHGLLLKHAPLREELRDVPRDRFALAVRIGGEIEGARPPHRPDDRLHVGFRPRHQIEVHGKAALGLDRAARGNEIAHVPVGREHREVGVEILSDGASLRRGLDDEEPPSGRRAAVPGFLSGLGTGSGPRRALRSAGGGRSSGGTGSGHAGIRFVSGAGGQHTRM